MSDSLNNQTRKVILIIMDGWGISPPDKFNAIDNARTPNMDYLLENYPNLVLESDGLSVGLPEGQFGTSEVNHLTIGTGRVIFQDLPRINQAIESEDFYNNEVLNKLADHAQSNRSNLNLVGILSDGGIHSHINHLFAIFELLNRRNFDRPVYLHLFADGRDVAPKSVQKYLNLVEEKINSYSNLHIKIATLQGRTLLDRDRDWEKTAKAIDLLRGRDGLHVNAPEDVFTTEYASLETDEYLPRYRFDSDPPISDKDAVFIFHYRTDRIYQLIKALYDENLQDLLVGSFVQPSEEFTQLQVAFPRAEVTGTLAEAISAAGKKQFHIAETEKFPHVTYFFNGERESELENEQWAKDESYRFVKPRYNYDPAMRNGEVTEQVISAIEAQNDFILVNLASTDMVGHTGHYEAALISTENVDYCVGKIYEAIKDHMDEYVLMVTADHGNSDQMWDYENNQPHTQHTTAPVPFVVANNFNLNLRHSESLADIAPTIAELMGIETPVEMTGTSMIA